MREALGRELRRHHYDTMSQDSGMQCVCHSDSRFEQSGWDHSWTTFGEHLADVSINFLQQLQLLGD